MPKDTRVILNEGTERAETFLKVFGRREVAVLSPFPVMVHLPGFDDPQRVYKLDLGEIAPDEMTRMVEHISTKFNIPSDEVLELIKDRGVPILASECVLVGTNLGQFL